MSVWYCIPSKRTVADAERCLSLWRRQGYRLALWRDAGDPPIRCDLLLTGEYPGYAAAVNALCREVLALDPDAEWLVTGGDDIEPDQNPRAEEIARQCTAHFSGTFGVMQPTGDRWGEDPSLPNVHPMRTAYADRVCCSPWMGREWCARMYGGNGPLFEGYYHMFEDEELQAVAQRFGVLWQRRDLIHLHRHWGREGQAQPLFLSRANKEFDKAKRLLENRKAIGFPGHEPLSYEDYVVLWGDRQRFTEPQGVIHA